MSDVLLENFDNWNIKKKVIQSEEINFYYRQAEIWWAGVGQNVGSESYGKGDDFRRPILVLKKLSKYQCIAIPLSTQPKDGSWFCEITVHGQKQYALLHQVKAFSVKRFQRKLAELDAKDFTKVKNQLQILLELGPENNQPPREAVSMGDSQK